MMLYERNLAVVRYLTLKVGLKLLMVMFVIEIVCIQVSERAILGRMKI